MFLLLKRKGCYILLKNKFRILFIVSISLLFFSCKSTPESELIKFKDAPLLGMVYDDNNQPCSSVEISLIKKGLIKDEVAKNNVLSDVEGRFLIPNVPKGNNVIQAEAEGLETTRLEFEFTNKSQVLYIKMISIEGLLADIEKNLKQNKNEKAEELISRAENIDSDDIRLKYLKSVLFMRNGYQVAALTLLEEIYKYNKGQDAVVSALADIYQFKEIDSEKFNFYATQKSK